MITTIPPSTSASQTMGQRNNLNLLALSYSVIVSLTLLLRYVLLNVTSNARSDQTPGFNIQFKMLKNESCVTICTEKVPPGDAKFINDRIREDYALNWLVDGLPAAEKKMDERTGEIFYDIGFNLGDDEKEQFKVNPALHNHYDIVLK
jgi:hypothetical protein